MYSVCGLCLALTMSTVYCGRIIWKKVQLNILFYVVIHMRVIFLFTNLNKSRVISLTAI